MKPAAVAVLTVLMATVWPQISFALPPDDSRLPRKRDAYLMEDDLVYARFLALAHDGTYRQINRDARGSIEVDRGRWTQETSGVLRLHSACRALRPRGLRSGPLSVAIADQEQVNALPRLVEAVRRLLAMYADDVFDGGTLADINTAGVPPVRLDSGSATFDRADADTLSARAAGVLESERTGDDRLAPVPRSVPALFTLPDSPFQEGDLADMRRTYKVAPFAAPPFYFARIDARKYASEVGRVRPLHLPGTLE